MDRHAPEAPVSGYEHLIDRLTLPDPNDRHVLAAVVAQRRTIGSADQGHRKSEETT